MSFKLKSFVVFFKLLTVTVEILIDKSALFQLI